jgi:hypothetical protein
MAEACSKIVKKSQVCMTGASRPGTTAPRQPAPGQSEIRVVERHASDAVLEIRCACGRHTYMHLRWPATGTPADPAAEEPREATDKC